MRKAERREWVWKKAQELAASGRFIDYRDIDTELTYFQGWPMAHSALDNQAKRDLLNRICAQARKRQGTA